MSFFFNLQWRLQVWKEWEKPFHLTRKVFGKKYSSGQIKFTERNYFFIDQLVKYIPFRAVCRGLHVAKSLCNLWFVGRQIPPH